MNRSLRTTPPSGAPSPPSRADAAGSTRRGRFHLFLKRLRAGGRSNMYGAIPYLMHTFELDREAAFRVVCEWVDQQAVLERSAADPGHRT